MAEDDSKDDADAALAGLLRALTDLRADVLAETRHARQRIDAAHARHQASARNLPHYLALRRRDLRPLQQRLAVLGLSSLGRAEAHVLATLDAVLTLLRRLAGAASGLPDDDAHIDFATGQRLLDAHTDLLLGPAPDGRGVRIMVTMPGSAATDYALVHDLLAQGMDCIRINCAHDDAATWSGIIANLRRAEQALGKTCKVAMDLAGPKLRTGPLDDGPRVLRIRPVRDVDGRVVSPGRVRLGTEAGPDGTALPVPAAWLARLREGDRVTLCDARDARRAFTVVEASGHETWLDTDKTAYVIPGTPLRHHRSGHKGKGYTAEVGPLPARAAHEQLHVRIVHARPGGDKLRADKGINLPETALKLAALTPKDIDDLAFVAAHADIVELSFANRAADVDALQERLAALGGRQPAIVLKIETRRGFENLPDMLLTALRSPCCGVMIARGDLAVESGFERLAEIQEEMLWVCEAAHVPVVWATQVLESLARDGRPSRAEITDAAMADRAECVMLNKGPHIVDAVKALDDILQRMQAHQAKKQSMLRVLRLAQTLLAQAGDGA